MLAVRAQGANRDVAANQNIAEQVAILRSIEDATIAHISAEIKKLEKTKQELIDEMFAASLSAAECLLSPPPFEAVNRRNERLEDIARYQHEINALKVRLAELEARRI